ncbi:MAG: N-6 DNA methylase [Bacteroidales bacterium]|nr:N-6 DNA methylase [Bacteroidales bacterium]
MQIFQRNILNKYIEGLDNTLMDERYKTFSSFFLDPERQANILNSKEEQFQEGFLRELFVKILGYTLNPDPNFNLTTEKKNETNSKKADGAILVDGKVVGVIELKDHKTPDLSKVEAQAFNYKSQHKEAVYVVISNFEKLRFYIDNAVDFEEFDLFHLTRDDFARLWICLAYENIAKNLPKQIKAASLTNEDQITNALYKDYSNFKRDLFEDILKNNPTDDTEHKILLFKKTQKLLDRLLFIFFAEDRGLLPPNSIMLIINQWEKLKDLDEYQPFYNRLKKYFGYMNTGFQGKNYEVFAYNGGLFKPDEILDGLTISDEVLMRYCKKISDYDFQSDVDVNILGHIFENSLTEIEEITTKLQQGEAPTISKRKKDGVFYTPQYITKYIVENTVGKLCREKKAELGIDDSEYFTDKKRQVATKKALIEKLDAYRDWLLQISICDPACGSGAFLNAALNFLIAEHKLIDEMQAKVEGASLVFPNVENSILENNLYGVDINEESVEIAKLSLWLRTAKPHRKLNSLNDNIKCGNSLIDDPAIAGDKAFSWQTEFPKVFEKGGFDVIIGNPPYVEAPETEKEFYKNKYAAVEGHIDLFEIFIQQGMVLLREKGYFAFINPNTVLSNLYSKKLRQKMVYEYGLCEVVNFGMDVFEDPTVHTCIILMRKGVLTDIIRVKQKVKTAEDLALPFDYSVLVSDIENNANFSFDLTLNSEERALFKKFKENTTLGDYCYIRQCIKTGNDTEYVKKSAEPMPEPWKKTLRGKGMSRYNVSEKDIYLKYGNWLARNWNNQTFYECDKIGIRETGDRINACLDTEHRYFLSSLYSLYPKEPYSLNSLKALLTVVNSRFATFYIQKIAFDLTEGAFTKVRTNQLSRLPLPDQIMYNDEVINTLSEKADQMLTLNSELQQKRQRFLHRLQGSLDVQKTTAALERFDEADFAALLAELKKQKISLTLFQKDEWEDYFNLYKTECNAYTSQINATDKEIDRLVYVLYGLTEEEIKVVEGK